MSLKLQQQQDRQMMICVCVYVCPTEMKASSDASFLPANNILLQQCGVSDLERCLVSNAADDDDGEKNNSESLCQTIIM